MLIENESVWVRKEEVELEGGGKFFIRAVAMSGANRVRGHARGRGELASCLDAGSWSKGSSSRLRLQVQVTR